jgi:CGNR zinc finger
VNQWIPDGEVPEEVRLINEVLNTLDLQRFGEHAAKPEAEREQDLPLALELRDALRAAAAANSGPPGGRSAGLSFEEFSLVVRLGGDSKPELASAEGGVKGALGTILANVAVAASKGTWARLKVCAAEDCRWAYYDHSKSRTGRWCAMETCGNRHKTRRYRQKKRRSAGAGS